MRTRIDVPVIADAGDFLGALEERLSHQPVGSHREWVATTQSWKERYPLVRPEHRDVEAGVSTYCLADALSDELGEGDIVATGSSGAAVELFLLAFRAKAGQRVIHSRGLGAMGFGIPASLGACLASGGRRTICVEGDGSFHMNAQELATIRRLSLPIKIFVVNNDGYASIRSSQRGYFDHLVAADPSSGLTLPSVRELATAYGLTVTCIEDQADLRGQVRAVLEMSGPVVCEVVAPLAEERAPRLSTAQRPDGSLASRPLEDLWPFLDRDELHSNMFIPLLES
jgi:acetolactate synthase-1/2/3 large subunit